MFPLFPDHSKSASARPDKAPPWTSSLGTTSLSQMLNVRVIPSKHAYFAGERFQARIEFRRDAPEEGPRGKAFPRGRHARKVSVVSAATLDSEDTTEPLETIKEGPDTADVTITFATIRITGHVIPSSTYIPPEPFLPLRKVLLHQPIGSGDATTNTASNGIDFSAGVDGTLATSLSGLAKGFLGAKDEGTWEERKRTVWAGKSLPVWIAGREVVGVELKVGKDGLSCEYALREFSPDRSRGADVKIGML